MTRLLSLTLPLLSLLTTTLAQTFTDCNPMNKTCPPNQGLGISNYTIDFSKNMMSDRVWNTTAGSIDYDTAGAEFVINARGDAPTVKTNFYIFFGQVEVIMKAASGQGVVSSIVLQSDDLDEVDWEWIGGNSSYVQTNYFGKGNTTSFDRAVWHTVDNPQDNYHNYTVDWSKEKLDWYIDDQIIRTLKYEDANGGHNFPQTPCDVRLGIWAGGDPKNPNGTVEWAGGEIDYSKAPFSMNVKSVRVSDASTGTQYTYSDTSGSFESIKVDSTAKALKLDGTNSPDSLTSATQKFNSLSTTNKIIIGCSVLGFFLICLIIFSICCIKQRRAGKHERLIEDAKFEKDTAELLQYRAQMSSLRNQKLAEARSMEVHSPMTPQGGMGYAGASLMGHTPSPNGNGPPGGYFGSQQALRSQNSGYAQSVSSYGSQSRNTSGGGYQRY